MGREATQRCLKYTEIFCILMFPSVDSVAQPCVIESHLSNANNLYGEMEHKNWVMR